MKIVYIVPGFGGSFYCQNCIRNIDLVETVKKLGHTPMLTPMYLPLFYDKILKDKSPIFFGAVSVYLRENFSFFRNMPLVLENILDSELLLKLVSKKSGTTNPAGLEEMTISVMRGAEGKHAKELKRLISYLKNEVKPDVVHFSNALLIGIAVEIKKELKVPVFCNLQDENCWLDKMEESYAKQGWKLMEEGAKIIDSFIAVSQYYADLVKTRIAIAEEKIKVVPIGINLKKFKTKALSLESQTIGFLSRMSTYKGLDVLVDAFLILKEEQKYKNVKLKITGGIVGPDKDLMKEIKRKLKAKGYEQDVIIEPELYKQDIQSFFDSLTLLSVPVPQGEAFGMFILESLASGIPVVQPEEGAYPEIIKNTGGGVLYTPNNAQSLAKSLADLLADPEKIKRLSEEGKRAVYSKYSIEQMSNDLIALYQKAYEESKH